MSTYFKQTKHPLTSEETKTFIGGLLGN